MVENDLEDFLCLLGIRGDTPYTPRLEDVDGDIEAFLPKEATPAVGGVHTGFIPPDAVAYLGEVLVLHHTHFSDEPFAKDRFEYALVRCMKKAGKTSQRATRGNPSYDVTIQGLRLSLKTQADAGIKAHEIHISKFMELGRGAWTDQINDLQGLRNQFLARLEECGAILILRCLSDVGPGWWHYELLEVPVDILRRAAQGALEFCGGERIPRSGYCRVFDGVGLLFELYFDGGSERKLQVRRLRKDICHTHAEWRFYIEPSED